MKKKVLAAVLTAAMAVSVIGGAATVMADEGVNYISEDQRDQEPAEGTDFSTLKIGEIEDYIVTDGGWDQANHESILAAMAELGIPEENLIVLEEIGEEQAAVQTAAEELINKGYIGGGMLPKLTNCTDAVRGGVHRVHILDGRIPHAILLEIFTNRGIGTVFYETDDFILRED